MHIDLFGHITLPTHGKDFNLVAAVNQRIGRTHHVALHSAKRKILKNEKGELHYLVGLHVIKMSLYAKIRA